MWDIFRRYKMRDWFWAFKMVIGRKFLRLGAHILSAELNESNDPNRFIKSTERHLNGYRMHWEIKPEIILKARSVGITTWADESSKITGFDDQAERLM